MLIEYALFLLLGIAAGVVAGLLPGLHVNNIGVIMLSLGFATSVDGTSFAIFLAAMATAQTFINFIPSIFLGVPDDQTVLSLLPSHKLLLEGRGMEAVRITAKASLYGIILALAMLPAAAIIIPIAYSSAKAAVVPMLIVAISYLILREGKGIFWAAATFFISGYLGYVCLGIPTLSSNQIMLPMFSGLFGIGTLLTGITTKSGSYKQDLGAEPQIPDRGLWRGSLLGTLGGILVGLFPGMSPSQMGIFFQEALAFKERAKGSLEGLHIRRFLTMVASLSAADSMFSIFGLYLMGNPRSGVGVIMQDVFGNIDASFVALICAVMLLSGLITYKIHIIIGEKFSNLAGRIDFRKLSLGGLLFMIVLIAVTSGPMGLLIAAVSTTAGLVPALTGVSRTHCMGCLLLPTLLWFLGF